MEATVKFYNAQKGYGFVVPDDNSGDVFVHVTACNGQSLVQNQRVEFEMGMDERKGKVCALDVRAI